MIDERNQPAREAEMAGALANVFTEVLRYVRFSDVEEWVGELKLQAGQLILPFVRCTAILRWDSEIHVLQHVSACAGFWGLQEFVELRSYCGSRMQGDKNEPGDRYVRIRQRVEEACKELGIAVRGGYYPNGGKGGVDA